MTIAYHKHINQSQREMTSLTNKKMDKKLLNFTSVAVEGFGLSLIGRVSSSQPLRLLGKRFGFENFGSYRLTYELDIDENDVSLMTSRAATHPSMLAA